jgi:hypothetical protein
VVGAIIFVVAMVLVVPIGVMFAGAAWSVLFGWLSSETAAVGQEGPGESASSE